MHSNSLFQNKKLFNNKKMEQSKVRKNSANDEATCKYNYIDPWKQNINTYERWAYDQMFSFRSIHQGQVNKELNKLTPQDTKRQFWQNKNYSKGKTSQILFTKILFTRLQIP